MGSRYETEGRADKCWRIARWCRSNGYDHETVAGWDDWQWEIAAAAAKVNTPSERSRGQVVGYLTPNDLWTPARTGRKASA